ncbi:hypothetical protein [uncultured Sneathiella sp.]|jgi:hypothetical protein|uniref:hypothetical protein n=1 Tax=uncultured Sneathiella sp. TaxID=879315 RepID=UPI0030D73E5E|tara:strand:+ start:595 stop:987 length:393 start_codon:yes stop_codon:yes gene_type:complete
MKTPEFLAPYVEGNAPVRLVQGLVVGAVATLVLGFGFAGWDTSGTVEEKVETASTAAKVAALAPICAARFQTAAKADNTLVANLSEVSSWQRDSHLVDGGWVTFVGGAEEPDNDVAEACVELIEADFKTL